MNTLFVAPTNTEAKSIPDKHSTFVCGVGIPNAVLNLSLELSRKKPDLIVHIGVAGSFSKHIPIGSVCFVSDDQFAELGAEDPAGNTLSLNTLGLETADEKFFSLALESIAHLPKVSSITVFRSSGSSKTISNRKTTYPHAQIESMEGAAVHFVAQRFKIPIIQIRSISNVVEPRNRKNWNLEKALSELHTFLCQTSIGETDKDLIF